jgi:hypothetical protein
MEEEDRAPPTRWVVVDVEDRSGLSMLDQLAHAVDGDELEGWIIVGVVIWV